MKIEVSNPALVDELLVFLRGAGCTATLEKDGSIAVDVPEAHGEEQARLELDLYLKAWQAAHGDVEARLLEP
jgi:hypothetical protein